MATQNGALTAAVTAGAVFAGSARKTGFPTHPLNVKVELLLNSTWTDITRYVLVRDDIVISPFGRTNESSGMDTGSLALTLKNTDGRFTPDNPSGAYYPYVQLNTQIRVSVSDFSVNRTGYTGYRFWGEVAEWPPQWDVTARDVYCQITASGIWRRLSQRSKTLGSPYTRYNNSLNSAYNLVGYWPMEDGQGSNYFATTTPSTAANMTISGPPVNVPTLAATAGFPGSDALPSLNAAEFDATISTSSHPTTNQFRFCVFMPSGGDTGRGMSATPTAPATIARMHTNGTVHTVDIGYGSPEGGGPLVITGLNSGGGTLFQSSSSLSTWGIPMLVLVSLAQVGGNIVWAMNTILPGGTGWNTTTTSTLSSATVDDAYSVIFNPGGTFNAACVGQASVYYGNPPFSSTSNALNAWKGENALTRFNRICAEENIPYENIGSTTTTMGPQVDDTIVTILQEIEDTDGGFLYEKRNAFGLGYRTMSSLQNQSSAVTLDYSQQQVGQPLNPVNDDAMVKNDITLTNYDGYSVRVYLANGARSLQNPPNGVGTGYEYSRNVSSTSHTQVNNLGLQLLNCGTVSKSRYPTITANLARTTTASLFNAIPSLRQGDFLKVNNMPAIGGASTQKQLVWGWTETINNFAWTIAFNTIPEDPWESSFNPGTSISGQVPASPTTQSFSAGGTGTVTSAQIMEGAIVGANLAGGAVQGGNIASATITATNIADATITGSLIANATITGANIASATIDGSNIISGSITGSEIASATITGSNIVNGTITGTQIGSGTITGSNIGSATISGSNLVNNTITATQIANATISTTQISATAGITGSQLANGTITATQIASATITASQISSTAGITGSQIAGGTITASNIQNATITNTQIAGGSITGSNIANNTITGANMVNATITSVQIANGTITTTQISNTAGITGSQLSATAGITAGQVSFTAAAIGGLSATFSSTAPGSPSTGDLWYDTSNGNELKRWSGSAWTAEQFGTNAIVAASVTTSLLAANAVTAAKIAAGTITATQIASSTITAANIASGTITATQIAAGTITGSLIAANTIDSGKLTSGIVVAGIVDATTITGASLVADGSAGQVLIYAGTPEGGNLIGSWSGLNGTDAYGNDYPAGLSVQTGVITGIDIDSVTITNATLQGDVLSGSTITNPAINGGSITETDLVFDQSGGQLIVYTSSTTTTTFSTAGDTTWTCPSGVTSAKIECWGAGAGGDGGSTSQGGNGGGGGEYARNDNYPVTAATTYNLTVGAGGTGNNTGGGHGGDGGDTFFNSGGVTAHGGAGNGTGGSGSTAPVHHNGGNGASASGFAGGSSGASSGGTALAGVNGNSSTGTTGASPQSAPSGAGAGGAGGNTGANGANASAPGGGGGGAGKGSSNSSQAISYAPLWTASYKGPDATSGANTLRSTTTMYQGGETASGGASNGNQRSVFGFNRTQMASDFSGYTITSCQLQFKNLHSWYNSGMYIEVDEYQGLPGSAPGTYPSADYRSADATLFISEGATTNFNLAASIAARFTGGSSNGLGMGHVIATTHPYDLYNYGYFDPSQIRFKIFGTTGGAGNFTGGNGGDGRVKITYTSGQNFLCAISPTSGTDTNGNAFAAGYTGPTSAVQPGSNPSAVETWHTMTLSNGWTIGSGGHAQYKLMPDNTVMIRLNNVTPGTLTDGTVIWVPPSGYVPSVQQKIPLTVIWSTAPATTARSLPLLYTNGSFGLEIFNVGLPGSVTSTIETVGFYALD